MVGVSVAPSKVRSIYDGGLLETFVSRAGDEDRGMLGHIFGIQIFQRIVVVLLYKLIIPSIEDPAAHPEKVVCSDIVGIGKFSRYHLETGFSSEMSYLLEEGTVFVVNVNRLDAVDESESSDLCEGGKDFLSRICSLVEVGLKEAILFL